MKKRAIIRSALLAASAMFALTGCGTRGTDLSKRYPEFFRYSFGENYTFKFRERYKTGNGTKNTIPCDSYLYNYTTENNIWRMGGEGFFSLSPYQSGLHPQEQTEDDYYLGKLEELVQNEIRMIFQAGFSSKIAGPYLGWDYGISDSTESMQPLFSVGDETEEAREAARTLLQPETGVQLCTATTESIVQDDRFYLYLRVRLNPGEDPARYLETMQAAAAEYRSMHPQNYLFLLNQWADDAEDMSAMKTLFCEYGILGETTEFDPRSSVLYSGEEVFAAVVREAYSAKHPQ